MSRVSEIVTHCGSKRKEEEYVSLGHDKHQVNFLDKANEAHIQAIALVDRELVVCIILFQENTWCTAQV